MQESPHQIASRIVSEADIPYVPESDSVEELGPQWDSLVGNIERAIEAERKAVTSIEGVLLARGFVQCDIAACNCGSWHHRYGLPERMDEIKDALTDAEVLDNSTGHLPLNAIKKLTEQRDTLRSDTVILADYLARLMALTAGKTPDWRKHCFPLLLAAIERAEALPTRALSNPPAQGETQP